MLLSRLGKLASQLFHRSLAANGRCFARHTDTQASLPEPSYAMASTVTMHVWIRRVRFRGTHHSSVREDLSRRVDRHGDPFRPRGLVLTWQLGARGTEANVLSLIVDVAAESGAKSAQGYYREALELAKLRGMRPQVRISMIRRAPAAAQSRLCLRRKRRRQQASRRIGAGARATAGFCVVVAALDGRHRTFDHELSGSEHAPRNA